MLGGPGAQPARQVAIELQRHAGLVLGPVDRGPGRRIDDHVGADPGEGLVKQPAVRKVAAEIPALEIRGDDLAELAQAGSQVTAELAGGSGQQYSHFGNSSGATSSRRGAFESLPDSDEGSSGHSTPIAGSFHAIDASYSGRYGRVHR